MAPPQKMRLGLFKLPLSLPLNLSLEFAMVDRLA